MTNQLIIRPEQENDIKDVDQIIKSAFKNHPHSNQNEHLLVSELRDKDVLSVSMVAENEEGILGHIAFTEVIINGKSISWYGLAPVSVDPQNQNTGVGSKLITEGLNQLKETNANGCVLVGEPDYYNQFGFRYHKNLSLKGVPEEYFLVLSFAQEIPIGELKYHQIFERYD